MANKLVVELSLEPVARDILFDQVFSGVHLYALASRPRWKIDLLSGGRIQASYWMDDGSIQPARILPLQAGVVACPSVRPHAHFMLQEAGQAAKLADPFLWFLSNRAWSAPLVTDETLEVHYIGRAVNKALTYTARDRFRSGHHKLEAIEADLLTNCPNRLLYALLGRLQLFEERPRVNRVSVLSITRSCGVSRP